MIDKNSLFHPFRTRLTARPGIEGVRPLRYDDRRYGYEYTRPVGENPFLKSTKDDLIALILAQRAVNAVASSSLDASVREGFRQLQAQTRNRISFPFSELNQAFSIQSVGKTDQSDFVFERVATAVLESHELRFEYRKLGSTKYERRRLHPYHLAEIDGGWYAIGLDPDRNAKRTFAVQRMRGVQLLETLFIRPHDFRLEDHFAGSFGVWSGDGRKGESGAYDVRIRFTGFAARFVSERRWHPSQEISEIDDNGEVIELRLQLTALEDVQRWVLGFGAQAKVLGPPELRKLVCEELRQAMILYEGEEVDDG